MWPPFRHPAKPTRGPHSTTSLYDKYPAAVAVVVRAELSGAASRHHRFLSLDRNRASGAVGAVALKDIEEDVLAFIQEGLGLAAGATPARVVSELQLKPPNDVSDSSRTQTWVSWSSMTSPNYLSCSPSSVSEPNSLACGRQ